MKFTCCFGKAILIAAILLDILQKCAHGYDDACTVVTETETFKLFDNGEHFKYDEIHVRHNIKGDVEIRDAPPELDQDDITVEIEKRASQKDQLSNFLVKQYFLQADYSQHFVIQVDYKTQGTSLAVVAAGVTGILILLALILLLICVYHKKHRDQTARVVQQSAPSPSQKKRSGDVTKTKQTNETVSPVTPKKTKTQQSSPLPYGSFTTRVTSSTPSRQRREYSQETEAEHLMPPPPPDVDMESMSATLPRMQKYDSGDYQDFRSLPRGHYDETEGHMTGRQCHDNTTYRDNKSLYDDEGGRSHGVGTPRGLQRSTLLGVSIMALVGVVYSKCLTEPTVKVIIYIPVVIQLGRVHVFYSEKFYNPVLQDKWLHRNDTVLKIYDVSEVKDIRGTPCYKSDVCPITADLSLTTCEPNSQSCVCQRGYRMDENNYCMDVDECLSHPHLCPEGSSCQNTVGSYVCHCGLGFYHQYGKCKVCSTGCPEGEHESIPCTYEADRVCTDAAHPVLFSENDTRAGYLEGLKVEHSDNVFMETLHNTKELSTDYFLTSNNQESDFLWYRDSGIRINMGVADVNIIPEFEDVTYQSDNRYVLDNPSMISERAYFEDVIQNHCRHPIPDNYMITQDTYRDRTTSAEQVVCGKDGITCAEGFHNGDVYVNRSLNGPCRQMGTYHDRLVPVANSIVCTEATDLLRVVFNGSAPPVRPIVFPSKQCKQASTRCQECLLESRCDQTEPLGEKCCQVMCYEKEDCKLAYSPQCTDLPVQCAMGDSYRYTIQPYFPKIQDSFSCHLKHKKPETFYKLWFYVTVLGRDFETPKIYTTIKGSDIENLSKGKYSGSFFTIEHNSGLQMREDVILTGKKTATPSKPVWNYTVYDMKTPGEYEERKMNLGIMAAKTLMAGVQFNSPFAYSSTTWVNGNNCHKNISLFQGVQSHYLEYSRQPVKATIQAVGEPYLYLLKSTNSPPRIKFIIPSNVSVLDWWFKTQDIHLLLDENFTADLSLSENNNVWAITLQGNMSDCPGYFNVIVNDRMKLEELFRYDVLVSCPPTFSVTFKVPNWGQVKDKTFDVILNDTHQEHTIYLTYLKSLDKGVWYTADHTDLIEQWKQTADEDVWSLFSLVVLSLLVFLGLVVFLHIFLECTKRRSFYGKGLPSIRYNTDDGGPYGKPHLMKNTDKCGAPNDMSCLQFSYLAVYLAFKIIYSLSFTFTIFYTVVLVICKADLDRLGQLATIPEYVRNQSLNISIEVENFAHREYLRQLGLFEDSQRACETYSEHLTQSILQDMYNISVGYDKHQRPNVSLSHILYSRHQELMGNYQKKIEEFEQENVSGFYENSVLTQAYFYKTFLKDVYKNEWLTYTQLLYNQSKLLDMLDTSQFETIMEGDALEFAKYLELISAEEVNLWLLNFWERYNLKKPTLPDLPVIASNISLCDHGDILHSSLDNASEFSKYRQMVSSRFFSPEGSDIHPSSRIVSKNKGMTGYYDMLNEVHAEIIRQWQEETINWNEKDRIDYLFEELDFSLFKTVFMCLDILLIIFRFSRMYMDGRNFCHGFQKNVIVDEMQGDGYVLMDVDKAFEVQLSHSGDGKTEERCENDYSTMQNAHKMKKEGNKTHSKHKPNGNLLNESYSSADEALLHKDTKIHLKTRRTFCIKLGRLFDYYSTKLVHTSLIPKTVIVSAMIFTLYIMLQSMNEISTRAVLLPVLGAIFPLFSKIRSHTNFNNWFLDASAADHSSSMSTFYKRLSLPFLQELQGLVQYFNTEQVRVGENFVNESCSINTSFSCDDSGLVFTQLHTPILPCDYVPIHTFHYKFERHSIEEEIASILSPHLSAAEHIISSVIHVSLILLTCIVAVHGLGALMFHCFKTRDIFASRVVYILTSVKQYIQLAEHTADMSVLTDIEYEPHNLDPSSCTTLMTSTSSLGSRTKHVKFSTHQTTVDVPRTSTVMTDLGYSETKV